MAEEEDLGDLYGDLDDDKVASPSSSIKGTSTLAASKASSLSSLKSPPPGSNMAQLEDKVKALEAENLTLKRNMGMLYRTARREIERKDKQISELMAELDKKNAKS